MLQESREVLAANGERETETLNRLAAIGEISAGIAHEIRNPLTTVRGFLQLLQQEYDHRYWEVIFPELDQAIATVQDLLSVSKPNLESEPKVTFHLSTDLESVISLFHNQSYRVRIEKRLYNTQTQDHGKRNQIKRAIFNLIKNAMEAIPGQGTISIEHLHDGLTQEIIQLAQERGAVWAKSDVPIITKMEWFYVLRKVIWEFLRFYHSNNGIQTDDVFELANRMSDALDNFIVHFNVTFTKYMDEILRKQEVIIEELSAPVIPIFPRVAVLPLIGTLDEQRLQRVEVRLLKRLNPRAFERYLSIYRVPY